MRGAIGAEADVSDCGLARADHARHAAAILGSWQAKSEADRAATLHPMTTGLSHRTEHAHPIARSTPRNNPAF